MEMQRRRLPERFLVVEVDSTEELPSEPDPGSAGSSLAFGMSRHPSPSAGHLFAELAESYNFAAGSPCVRSILGPCRGPGRRTGRAELGVTIACGEAVCKGAPWAFNRF